MAGQEYSTVAGGASEIESLTISLLGWVCLETNEGDTGICIMASINGASCASDVTSSLEAM